VTKPFNQYAQKQLEALVESTQFNTLERKDMRDLFLELLARLRAQTKQIRALEMVVNKF